MKTTKVTNLKGEAGGEYYSDTTAHTGEWDTLLAVGGDATFSAITSNITNLPSNHTITQNIPFHAKVTAFTLASGNVIAYQASAGQPVTNS